MFLIPKQQIEATETSDNYAETSEMSELRNEITQASETRNLGRKLTVNRLTWSLFRLKSLNLIAFQANRSENLRVRTLFGLPLTIYLFFYRYPAT